eukprot:COSAG02_NODE_619_length_19446_cov_9.557141_7_plen_123_part_00
MSVFLIQATRMPLTAAVLRSGACFVAAVAMPYMLDQAGTIAGVIMFVISMGLTQLSIARLLDVAAALQRRSTSVSVHRPLLGAPTETEDTANLVRAQTLQSASPIKFWTYRTACNLILVWPA